MNDLHLWLRHKVTNHIIVMTIKEKDFEKIKAEYEKKGYLIFR